MNVRVEEKDCSERIHFILDFEEDTPESIWFHRVEENFITDENDDCFGRAHWTFYAPERDTDTGDALFFLRTWFKQAPYLDVFNTLGLKEQTGACVPGAMFRKDDLWSFFHDVLIIVHRSAYDV